MTIKPVFHVLAIALFLLIAGTATNAAGAEPDGSADIPGVADARVLISTDALLERITPHIGVHPFYGGDPLSEYLESLRRLGELEVDRILPSHGDPFEAHAERVEAVEQHHERRLDKIHGVVDGSRLHAYAVAGVVWGEERSLMDRRFAMAEALSHLEYLRRQGRVERLEPDGVAYWSAKS